MREAKAEAAAPAPAPASASADEKDDDLKLVLSSLAFWAENAPYSVFLKENLIDHAKEKLSDLTLMTKERVLPWVNSHQVLFGVMPSNAHSFADGLLG